MQNKQNNVIEASAVPQLSTPQPSTPSALSFRDPVPWPDPVNGSLLLDALAGIVSAFVILPARAADAIALWILHTYAFRLRDISTYLGIESPLKRCGKTTLLTVLGEMVHRPIAAANVSPPAFFRVIEELAPTLLIDEADNFLPGNDQLRGILNSGYSRKNAFVLRATASSLGAPKSDVGGSASAPDDSDTPTAALFAPHASRITHHTAPHQSTDPSIHQSGSGGVSRFSCWCPKVIATIGRLPDTLADRCIVIRMQRKTPREQCARLRDLNTEDLRRQCKRFILDHEPEIAAGRPSRLDSLDDRATDIWEPLFVLADIVGGDWPKKAREAAETLSVSTRDTSPITSLLLDIVTVMVILKRERIFTRDLVDALNFESSGRPWAEALNGKPLTDIWLARQLRPYGIKSKTIWIGDEQGKGFQNSDFHEASRRYVSRADYEAHKSEWKTEKLPQKKTDQPDGKALSALSIFTTNSTCRGARR